MRRHRLLAPLISASLAITLAACAKQDEPSPSPQAAGSFLYGSDGNVQNGFAVAFKEDPGILSGMKGTAPLAQLSQDFRTRLAAVDPNLRDLIFAGETYDAAVIAAIATQLAGTTDPKAIAKQINGVTTGADKCTRVADCLALAKAGKDPAYRGATVSNGFTAVGEPSTASYGVFHFGPNNQLDNGKTEYLNTGNEKNATTEQPVRPVTGGKSGAPLVLGGLLPQEGGLAFAYAPMIAGARLAVREINEAGGVLGQSVVWKDGNDFTDPQKALGTVAKHKADGVHVIIGAGGSGVSVAVLPEVIKGGMVMISPSNTAAKLSELDDSGLYFRTAPSDILQARALADVMLRDGITKICIVARKDAYGEGLMSGVQKELAGMGLTASVQTFTYDVGENGMIGNENQVRDVINQIVAAKPEGVLVIGFEESAAVIKGLNKAGVQFRR
ncbi:ABC transporter substrate-binding protein [Catelliglobosispora koreensis]|uniref:ABC transporter substrate-binding protein n=1 Tax=Catelliglobosispora koreensis TaxID=129052 RepID=UPI00058DEE7B|nr:ABC transporter substrate-binding protein [Catelliglobosispora koreensis]